MTKGAVVAFVLLAGLLAACDDMAGQDRVQAYDAAAPPPIPGTVARGALDASPRPDVTPVVLARGADRFAIHCQPCHGARGLGDGPVAGRTMPFPPAFEDAGIQTLDDVVMVIVDGHGAMPSYADRIKLADRWAVAAHVLRLRAGED